MYRMLNKRGFTLIELMVVVAIIGMLSSVVLSSLNTARGKGRDAQRISDIKQLKTALQLYYEDNGQTYPTALSGLAPKYIGKIPTDPSSQTISAFTCGAGNYCYAYYPSTSPNFYHLGAKLEFNNSVLNSDTDCRSDSATAACVAGQTTLNGGNFNGASNGPGGTDNVYDLTS